LNTLHYSVCWLLRLCKSSVPWGYFILCLFSKHC